MIPTPGIAAPRTVPVRRPPMNLLAIDPSLPWCVCTALSLFAVGAAAPAQQAPDAETQALLARIDAARGTAPATLAIEGTYAVTIGGQQDAPVAKGTFRELFAGESRARQTCRMGELGAMERGLTDDLAWELDPMMGAKVHKEAQDVTVRRYFAILRGARPTDLYREFARTGTQQLDGREHVVLRMTPKQGKAETWYVDAATATVDRVDLMLPAPESADATFAMGDWMEAQLTFGDWKAVDGVLRPHRRAMKMGPATVAFTCTKIETGVKTAPADFAAPAAVLKVKDKEVQRLFDAEGKPIYAVVEQQAQPVATIRTKCKPGEISATLAVILPEIGATLAAGGIKMSGPPFARYHAFSDTEVDIEAGIPVSKPITEKGRVKNSELPAGRAVTVWHIGPYEQLSAAHKALQEHMAANQQKARGGPWEVYWTDPGMVPDPAKWRTQIFAPIE